MYKEMSGFGLIAKKGGGSSFQFFSPNFSNSIFLKSLKKKSLTAQYCAIEL